MSLDEIQEMLFRIVDPSKKNQLSNKKLLEIMKKNCDENYKTSQNLKLILFRCFTSLIINYLLILRATNFILKSKNLSLENKDNFILSEQSPKFFWKFLKNLKKIFLKRIMNIYIAMLRKLPTLAYYMNTKN